MTEDLQSLINQALQSSDPALQKLARTLEEKEQEIHRLKKKNEILVAQNMELTQEMENIRGDFGGEVR